MGFSLRGFLVHCEGVSTRGGACSQTNENQMSPSLPGMPHSLQPQTEASCWTLIVWCAACSTLHQQPYTDNHSLYNYSAWNLWGYVTWLIHRLFRSDLLWLNGIFFNHLLCDVIVGCSPHCVISLNDNNDFNCGKQKVFHNICGSFSRLVLLVFNCVRYLLII